MLPFAEDTGYGRDMFMIIAFTASFSSGEVGASPDPLFILAPDIPDIAPGFLRNTKCRAGSDKKALLKKI